MTEARRDEGERAEDASDASERAEALQAGTRDEHYDLVSVLYHSLQAAETCETYCMDAEDADDDELFSFFREVQEMNMRCAERAKQLLVSRIGVAEEGGEEAQEEAA